MQALGGLSPDQQQAILQRVTGQSGTGSGTQGAPNGPQQSRNNTGANGQPNSTAGTGTNQAQAPGMIPVFGPEDSVLLDINLPGEKTVAQQAADVYARELNATAMAAPQRWTDAVAASI